MNPMPAPTHLVATAPSSADLVDSGFVDAPEESLFGDRLDLRHMLALVRRYRISIAVIMVAAMAVGVAVTLLTVPHYIATSTVLVEQQADQIIEDSSVNDSRVQPDVERFLQTQLDVLHSREPKSWRRIRSSWKRSRCRWKVPPGLPVPPARRCSGRR
jgi:hypothetical protein